MKIQFSKVLPIISSVILFLCLYWAATCDVEDTTTIAVIVSGAFTFALTTNVFYMRNSQAEKVANIRANTYKIASQERLNYNKEMMLFMKENGFTQSDIEMVEVDSPMDEFENNALDSLSSSVDSAMEDATTPIEIQHI